MIKLWKNENLIQEGSDLCTIFALAPSRPRCQWCFTCPLGSYSDTTWIFNKGKTDWKLFQSCKYFFKSYFRLYFCFFRTEKNTEVSEIQLELQAGRAKICFLMRSLALSMSTETSSHGTINTAGDELKPGVSALPILPMSGRQRGTVNCKPICTVVSYSRRGQVIKIVGRNLGILCLRYPLGSLHKKAFSWYADVLVWKWASCSFPKITL